MRGTYRIFRATALSLILGSALLPGRSRAEDTSLIRIGDLWRYVKSPSGLAPGPGWNRLDYDDSRWAVAGSGFEMREDRKPPLEIRRTTVFIRHRFEVRRPADIKMLLLRVEHEEGFVAYLNGREILRQKDRGLLVNRATDPLLVITQIDLSRFINQLVEGPNVLALEGVQTGFSPAAFVLAPALLANFSRGPFVQNMTAQGTQVIWRTLQPGTTFLEYGTTPALGTLVTNTARETTHVVTLKGLSPDTTYYYRAGSVIDRTSIASDIAPFRTFKTEGPITFMALGDTGQGTIAQAEIAEVMRRENPELVLHGGDIVYGGFGEMTVDTRYFNYYERQIRTTPFFLAIGNHELFASDGGADTNATNWHRIATNFQAAFYLPTNSVTGTEHFYSFDHGDAHFVALYNPWFHNYVFTNTSDQYRWMTNDLAHSKKPWKFMFLHSPIAHSGSHALYDNNNNGVLDQTEMMQLLLPVAERYGVDLIFGSHDHNFERFAPTNGLHHVVTGGGGASLYVPLGRHPASAQFWLVNHCLKVHVEDQTLTLDALGTDGVTFDSMIIHRTATPRQVYQSAWHTPKIEAGRANDGDGNIHGQTFNLTGTPILTRSGRFSNLGRFYVNNDDSHLYLGLSRVMIYGDNNVYLFIETPSLQGVSSLQGLGNGVVDGARQGADGLDFLENLSFTNFSPGIGCILGDEFADGQYRSFLRANWNFNAGQGVFRLDSELSNVQGIRLQQFNRSPQGGEGRGEQNADLIEIAIPFRSLGNLRPGEVIKVGAVVGGGDVNLRAQTRALDTGFLGYSMRGSGHAEVVLEGVEVKLAERP